MLNPSDKCRLRDEVRNLFQKAQAFGAKGQFPGVPNTAVQLFAHKVMLSTPKFNHEMAVALSGGKILTEEDMLCALRALAENLKADFDSPRNLVNWDHARSCSDSSKRILDLIPS